MSERVLSKGRTTPMSHAVHSNRFPCSRSISFPVTRTSGRFEHQRQSGGGGSGSNSEKQAVESQTKPAQENQRREDLRHEWKDGDWQWNPKGSAVTGSEIVDHACEKHVQKAAANLVPPVRPLTSRQLHLRNRLAAKGALRQTRRHLLAAKYAAARVPGLFSKSAHTAPIIPHHWTSCPLGRPGCTCLFVNR